MEGNTGYALLGMEDAPEIAGGFTDPDKKFSLQEFIQDLKTRDDLDEALQPVFRILSRDFPGHRLIVTPAGATLEESKTVATYVYIEGAKAVAASIQENRFCNFFDALVNDVLPNL